MSLVTSIANQPGVFVVNLPFSSADIEGAYRFTRNENIDAQDIAEAGYQATVSQANEYQEFSHFKIKQR
ncbi:MULTISPECIES: transposase DNA-binding-containing protein [Vibrio harveyi group]|uniref:transposase DNA-binding-containing protein n=1 Tax=Vibrio harveyi group TaxID=717610 RepID=UPI000BAE6EC6|nr:MULTISPECIES: hypothetical protein [Vibrio harveyi group]PAW10997.1 hypothetical protein B6K85_09020 [Vibrio sp. V1B]